MNMHKLRLMTVVADCHREARGSRDAKIERDSLSTDIFRPGSQVF